MRSRNRNRLLLVYLTFFLSQCYPKESNRYTEGHQVASGDPSSCGYLVLNWIVSNIVWLFTEAKAEEQIAVFTFVLTVATIGLWVATWKLFKTADNTSRTQLRAYLLPHKADMLVDMAVPDINVVVIFKNYGATPAYQVQTFGAMCICPIADESRLLPVPKRFKKFAPFTIGPTGRTPRTLFHSQPTPQELDGLTAKPPTHAVYAYGRVEYTDAFDIDRFTDFRYAYAGTWPPATTGMNIGREGNESN